MNKPLILELVKEFFTAVLCAVALAGIIFLAVVSFLLIAGDRVIETRQFDAKCQKRGGEMYRANDDTLRCRKVDTIEIPL